MTPQQRKEAARYLKVFDFSGLFGDPSIGWDWPETGKPLKVPVPWRGKDEFHTLETVAEKRGVRVFHVPPLPDSAIMPSDERKKLEKAVTPLATEHLLIFTDAAKTRQIWLWTSRLPGKPVRHRELTWEKGRENELLLQKLTSIAFTLDEEEALDITGVVQRLRDNLDRDRLTKRFYDDFKKHKDAFQKFIKGISDEGIMAHYTSLMLNRLMFCYFLQQKGFLDGDQHYLRNRFETVRDTLGKNKFHSFYRTFLKRLFHDGLDAQSRPDELTAIIGKNIPYLNGGIFAEHPIERAHPDITIPDEAFGKIFDFFDEWNWHLDDRPLSVGNEINPEVLGYVFEKYTNQKEMGAYYTKEDITEYISKNTILPFLLQKIAAKLPAGSWDLLKNDPDRYIYEPVRRGVAADCIRHANPLSEESAWKASLPENIAIGLDANAPDLIARRKHWNTPTPSSHALPTEIWRETIARHQRCHSLREKLRAGEVTDPADLVTLNLDIRQFTQDVISSAPGDLALAMWKALRAMSVLDPTCGSGAFLFAALEILEPLYEGLLERLRALLADWQSSGEKHPNWEKEIKAILAAVDHHPNEAYFIHKTIIVHNLYGVDIMEEAVEICKLRLFLKLAAQLQPGQAVEPLPDIDFNVRSGNTLVGYASRDEIRRAFTEAQGGKGGEQMALLGIENSLDDFRRIMEQAEDADRAFRRFQDLQDTLGQSAAEFATAKRELERILASLRSQLDRFLAGQYGQKNLRTDATFKEWQDSHEPFHWFVEFYGIMNGGGFDVIVGNPPYIVYPTKVNYELRPESFVTLGCKNLYGIVFERSARLVKSDSWFGLIVQMTLMSAGKMEVLQDFLMQNRKLHLAPFPRRPESMFDGVEMPVAIGICSPISKKSPTYSSSRVGRIYGVERPLILDITEFFEHDVRIQGSRIAKFRSKIDESIFNRLKQNGSLNIGTLASRAGNHCVFYQEACRYWLKASHRQPFFRRNGEAILPPHGRSIFFRNEKAAAYTACLLNSSLFYWFYSSFSDCEHVNDEIVRAWNPATEWESIDWQKVATDLVDSLESNATEKTINTKQGHKIEYHEIKASSSKTLIDQIDTLLAKHYGFTEEELDFIINYDIKYRMGLGGGSAEEDDE